MISKKYRLQLARLLKLYAERSTDRGLLVAENDNDIMPGVEVFQPNEHGEMEPAMDGIYVDEAAHVQIVVEGGTVKEMVEITPEEEQSIGSDNGTDDNTEPNETSPITENETPTEEPENTEESEQTEEPAEQNPTEEPDKKDEEIRALTEENTALKQQIAELEKLIAEYKEKENAVPPTAEMKEKFKAETGNKAIDKTLRAAQNIAKSLNN